MLAEALLVLLPPVPLLPAPLVPPPDPPPLVDPPPPLPELAVLFAIATWSDFFCDAPFASETERSKVKFPLALGVPETVPELSVSIVPVGSWPETTEKI